MQTIAQRRFKRRVSKAHVTPDERQHFTAMETRAKIEAKLGSAVSSTEFAESLAAEAREERQMAVRYARKHGWSLSEIAKVLGVTRARVQQISEEYAQGR
jgi:DNA-directed RNA polymerase specialized sigma subunit